MAFGKVVKLFLLDGTPNGRWICELSNWTGIAYKIPRSMVKESDARKELGSPGIYFLFGYDESNNKPLVYIGEAEDIIKRLKQHLEKKDNWTEAIAFISKDSTLNKAHIKYLEHQFYNLARESARYTIDNNNTPTRSTVSEAEQAELEEFMYNAKILVNALGHKVFEKYTDNAASARDTDMVFSLAAGTGKAHGMRTSDGFVLMKGSSIHKVASDSLNIGIRKKVDLSRESGEIVDDVLQCDKLFSSSSAAAAFAVGYSISGPQQWKNDRGETLKSIETRK